jgi:hypothetical protein
MCVNYRYVATCGMVCIHCMVDRENLVFRSQSIKQRHASCLVSTPPHTHSLSDSLNIHTHTHAHTSYLQRRREIHQKREPTSSSLNGHELSAILSPTTNTR